MHEKILDTNIYVAPDSIQDHSKPFHQSHENPFVPSTSDLTSPSQPPIQCNLPLKHPLPNPIHSPSDPKPSDPIPICQQSAPSPKPITYPKLAPPSPLNSRESQAQCQKRRRNCTAITRMLSKLTHAQGRQRTGEGKREILRDTRFDDRPTRLRSRA